MFELTGRVALVTGASRGLGREDALTLARAGADVVITDILVEDDPDLQKTADASGSVLAQVAVSQGWVHSNATAEEIRKMGRRSLAIKMDVTNREQVREVFKKVRDEFGKLDILINNAATLDHTAQIPNQSYELWDRDVKVNLTGAFNCTKEAWPYLVENKWGRIIFMSSVAGTLGGFGQASYSATKAALIGLAKTAALEGGRHNITSNAIAPGIIESEAGKAAAQTNPMYDRFRARTVFKRFGQPEDIANTIAFLCSNEAGYITGAVIELADVRRDGAIARVVMHRKGNNSIAEDLMSELATAFNELGEDPSVRVVVLASEYEKYFSVGADLASLAGIDRSSPDAADQIGGFMRRMNAHFAAIERCPKPVIAAINGHALGGGSELTLCCDFRIMVEDGRSKIGQTESSLGIIPGAGGTQRLPRLIGKARALRYIIESARLSAKEAEAVGWVDQAVAPEELNAAVAARAAKLAKAATFAIAMIKDAVRRGNDLPLDEALEIEARNFARAALSDDAAIGILSFLSKQEPEFTGS